MCRGYLLFDIFHFIRGTDYGRLDVTARQRTATKITVEITGRIFYGTKESVYHDNDYIKPCPADCRAAG